MPVDPMLITKAIFKLTSYVTSYNNQKSGTNIQLECKVLKSIS